jgi:site-specific recombinase XerD
MEEEYIDFRHVQETYERAMARFLDEPSISQRNKDLMAKFCRDAALGKTMPGRGRKKIGPARLTGYFHLLRPLIDFLKKDLDKVNQDDMENFIEALEAGRILTRARRMRGTKVFYEQHPLGERYIADMKITIKKFYKWLWGESKTYPKLVEWIDTYMEPKEVSALTEAEVNRMLDLAGSPRVKALVQVLFDGGFRIEEFLNIRLRHLWMRSFDPQKPQDRLFVVRVPFSKTLRRTVVMPMHATTKWLSLWLEDHPAKPKVRADGTIDAVDTAAQLFPMTEEAIRSAIRRLGQLPRRGRGSGRSGEDHLGHHGGDKRGGGAV